MLKLRRTYWTLREDTESIQVSQRTDILVDAYRYFEIFKHQVQKKMLKRKEKEENKRNKKKIGSNVPLCKGASGIEPNAGVELQ